MHQEINCPNISKVYACVFWPVKTQCPPYKHIHRRIPDIFGGLRDKFIRMCIDCVAVKTQQLR